MLLTRYDYISLAEESDFYVVEFTADERESALYNEYQKIRNDSIELRWFQEEEIRNDPKLAPQKSITLKFHDGAKAGEKIRFENKDRITIGRSPQCDIFLPIST